MGTDHCLDTKKLELQHAERACKLRLAGATAPLETDKRALEGKVKLLQEALTEAQKQREVPFWEDPRFTIPVAFAAGVVAAAGMAYGAVWAVGQLRPAIPPAGE